MTATGFVLAAGVCLLVAVTLAAWPLLRTRNVVDTSDRRGTNVDLYRQRVEEIERDRDAGVVSAAVAESLAQELAATLLDDAAAKESETSSTGRSKWAAAIVVVAVTAISLTMYHRLGAFDAVRLGESPKMLRDADADPVGPMLEVTIDIGDALRHLPPTAALFVAVRKPGERVPLLVARQPVDATTMTVRLDRTNAMQGDVTLSEGETLNIAARLSESGVLSVGADDPHANQEGVRLTGAVTPVRLALGTAAQTTAATEPAPAPKPPHVADVAVRLNITLAPEIDAGPSARVFVIARAPAGSPMPIAVRALDPADLPEQLVFTDRDAMQANRVLSMLDRVEVLARLSRSGNPMHEPGDVESVARVLDPRSNEAVELVIGG